MVFFHLLLHLFEMIENPIIWAVFGFQECWIAGLFTIADEGNRGINKYIIQCGKTL